MADENGRPDQNGRPDDTGGRDDAGVDLPLVGAIRAFRAGIVAVGLLAFVTSTWWIDAAGGRGDLVLSGCLGSVAILVAAVLAALAGRSSKPGARLAEFSAAAAAAFGAYAAWVLALSKFRYLVGLGVWPTSTSRLTDVRIKGDLVAAGIVLVLAGTAAWLSWRGMRQPASTAVDMGEGDHSEDTPG